MDTIVGVKVPDPLEVYQTGMKTESYYDAMVFQAQAAVPAGCAVQFASY